MMRSGAGFTVLELLVAVTVFLISTAAVWGLLAVGRADRSTTSERVGIMQTVRASLNLIKRDGLDTGFGYPGAGVQLPTGALTTLLGIPADGVAGRDVLTPVVSGHLVNPTNLNTDPRMPNSDQVTFTAVDYQFNGGQAAPISTITSSQVTLSSGTIASLGCQAGDIYLVKGNSSSAIVMMTGSSGTQTLLFGADPLNINQTSGSNGKLQNVTVPATLTRIKLTTYRLFKDGTLVRTVYNNIGGSQDQPIAYNITGVITNSGAPNVTGLQVQYIMRDGTYTFDPVAGPDNVTGDGDDTPPSLQNVRQIQVTIGGQSTAVDPRNNQPYKTTMSTTFDARNIGYDAQ